MRLYKKAIMRFFFALVFFALPACLNAQVKIFCGYVTDTDKKHLLVNANVTWLSKTVTTNKKGFYALPVSANINAKIVFSFVGYFNVIKQVETKTNADTIWLNIEMKSSLIDLPEVDIIEKIKPDTVVGNNNFFIEDFEFYNDKFILLTTDKKTNKYSVAIAKEGSVIIAKTQLPEIDETYFLYTDFLGYTNIIGKEKIYRLKISEAKIVLQQLPPEDYRLMIMPCVDTVGSKIIFSDYRKDYPEFNYYKWARSDSTASVVHHVIDKPLADLYAFEYEFLPPKLKLYARKLEQQSGVDRYQIAAYMTNFSNSRYFTPLYAPMYIINDTLMVFDHYANKIYKYDTASLCIDSIPVSYHHPQKWREWKRMLIKDDNRSCIYGLFLKGDITYLKQINFYTGNIISVSKLEMPFVEKIKIKDGFAYYLYRPHGSLQSKFLYKETISSSPQ
jgi:hypothetical protein